MGTLFDTIVQIIKDLRGFKFYFVAVLVFLFVATYTVRDSLTLYVKSHVNIQFRECRDQDGLSKAMEGIMKKDTILETYAIYLYEPINSSIYKRVVATNSNDILHSPTLQGIYLDTQPTLNRELLSHDYYLANTSEMASHEDTRYWLNFSNHTRLCYGLKVNNKVVGELWFRFKHDPTPIELDRVLHDASPLLYNYIL